jgi:hypothetical protein
LWLVFNVDPSADALQHYLESVPPYDEIYMMLFSHGTDSIGLAPITRWRALLQRARQHGAFLGVDEKSYPRDFATLVRYHQDIKHLATSYPLPVPFQLDQLNTFLQHSRYPVQWIESVPSSTSLADSATDSSFKQEKSSLLES